MRSAVSATQFGNLFDGVDLNTPEGLEKVIVKLVSAGKSLVNITKGMVDSFKPFFDVIGERGRQFRQSG